MASTLGSTSSNALKTFELANGIAATDAIYRYDAEEQRQINRARPWRSDPHHFKKVRVSATALIKMVMHARSGGVYEIMGLMQGKIDGDTFVVMDAFPLPVIGTETRVNAANEANEYMVQYQDTSSKVGRLENVVGWYHSHPGYGCWLSGIDVMTQMTNQAFQDPFLAIVIDPNRTISAGRVDIGAFRTYPEGYTPPNAATSEYQSIPLSKIEDFGVHASRYYQLEIEHFKSSLDTKLLDLLWNKYWVMTLSQSPLITNRAYTTSQISDLTDKLSRAEASITARPSVQLLAPEAYAAKQAQSNGKQNANASQTEATTSTTTSSSKKEDPPLTKAVRDSTKLSCECNHGLINQLLKSAVFNNQTASASLNLPPSLLAS